MSEPNHRPIPEVAPPVPAPYLADVPQLPDDLLRAMRKGRRLPVEQARLARRLMRELRLRLFLARDAYNEQHGVKIESEPRP